MSQSTTNKDDIRQFLTFKTHRTLTAHIYSMFEYVSVFGGIAALIARFNDYDFSAKT